MNNPNSVIYETDLASCMKKIYNFFISFFMGKPDIYPGTKKSIIIENLALYFGIPIDDINSLYLLDLSKYESARFKNVVIVFVDGESNRDLNGFFKMIDYNINNTKTLYCFIDDSIMFEYDPSDSEKRLQKLFMSVYASISAMYNMSIYDRFVLTPAFITTIYIMDYVLKDKELLYKISKELPKEATLFAVNNGDFWAIDTIKLNEKIKEFEAKVLKSYEGIVDAMYELYECLDIVNFGVK